MKFSVLGDKIFPDKHFYQPLIFEIQTGSEPKFVLNGSFAHSLIRFYAQITTFSLQFDDLDDFQKLWQMQIFSCAIKLHQSQIF